MSIEERKELLLKPFLRISDIQKFFGVSKTKAWEIKEKAIRDYEGGIEIGSSVAKTEAVLAVAGLDRAEELLFLSKL